MALNPKPAFDTDSTVPSTASAAVKYLSLEGLKRFAISIKAWAEQTFLVKKVTLGEGTDNIAGTNGTLNIKQGAADGTTNVGGHLSITAADGVLTFNDTLATWEFKENSTTATASATGGMLLSKEDYETFKQMAAGGLNLSVVKNLPTTDISTTTIYLVKDSKNVEGNIYAEYIYVNSKWEYIGTTETELSGYAKKDDALSGTVTGNDLIDITIGGTVSTPTLDIVDTNLVTALGKKANSADTISANSGDDNLVKVTLSGSVGTPTVSVDDKALETALKDAADAFKGQTTLTASENKDLLAGNVTLTLGGDGAAANQTITLSQVVIPDAAVKSVAGSGAGYISASAANGTGNDAGKWTVSVSAKEVKAGQDGKYGSTGLATDGYVNEQVAGAKAAVTGGSGSDAKNLITVTTAATTAAPTVTATLTSSTGTATAIATDKYVEEKIAAAAVAGGSGSDAKNLITVTTAATTAAPTVTATLTSSTGTATAIATDGYVIDKLGTKTASSTTPTTVWGAIEALEGRENITHTAISDQEIDALF